MTAYRINLSRIETFQDFINAFNAGMIETVGGKWNGNLNAFNDYLYWPEPHPYELVLIGWTHCAAVLAKLSAPGGGSSMLSVIEEVLADNPQAVVTFA